MGEVRLLELKARHPDLDQAERWCAKRATPIEEVAQTDTYFPVGEGRLKLRVVRGRAAGTLIAYWREDTPGPKRSRVSLLAVADPASLLSILRGALGVLVEVRKRRQVFRWGEVQVHLDRVEGLGSFVEFERRVDSREAERKAEAEFAELRAALQVPDEALEPGSYGDLLLQAETRAG